MPFDEPLETFSSKGNEGDFSVPLEKGRYAKRKAFLLPYRTET